MLNSTVFERYLGFDYTAASKEASALIQRAANGMYVPLLPERLAALRGIMDRFSHQEERLKGDIGISLRPYVTVTRLASGKPIDIELRVPAEKGWSSSILSPKQARVLARQLLECAEEP